MHGLAQGANLRTSMKQARHVEASATEHLRHGQCTLSYVKTAGGKTDTAKAGLDKDAARDMTTVGLRRSVRLVQAELARRGKLET